MRTLIQKLSSGIGSLRDWQLFLIVHCLFIAVAMWQLLFGTSLFIGLGLGHSYSFFDFNTVRHWFSGDMFMNRFNMNGFPSFVPIGFALNPFTYLFNAILPRFDNLHWFVFANMVSGGTLCSILLRRFNISRDGAIVGGICYMTGSWWLVVTPEFTPSMPILPLIALIVLQSRTRPMRAMIFGSLLCGYTWLGLPTQVSLMLFAAFGSGAIALALWDFLQKRAALLRPLYVLFVSLAIGTVIGIPKFIPAFVYGNLSWRAGGLPIQEAAASGLQPLTIVTYLFPYISFPFLNFGGELLQVFIGAFGLAFLMIGLRMAFARNASRLLRWWVFAYIMLLFLAFNHSPLAALLSSFPPFSYFRGAGRWTMMSSFAVAPVVGFAFDALMNGRMESMRKKLAIFFGWLTALLSITLAVGQIALFSHADDLTAFFQRYFAYFHQLLHLGPPLSYYNAFVERRIHELAASPLILEPRALFPFLSLVMLAVVLQKHPWKYLKNKPGIIAFLTLTTTAISLISYNHYYPRKDFPTQIATVDFLKTHPGTALGIFSNGTQSDLAPGYRFTTADDIQWTMEHLVPNTNLQNGIHVLDYFDNISSRRPTSLASWVGAQWLDGPDMYNLRIMQGTVSEKINEFMKRKDILDLQGVRYIVTSFPLPGTQFKQVFITRITSAKLPVMIYENPTARPLAYFASSVATMPESETGALDHLLHGQWPSRKTLLECGSNCAPMKPDGNGSVIEKGGSAEHIVLTTNATSTQWLVVTVNRLPGWTVLIDEKVVPSVYANATYFGIPVPAGKHTVELRFSVLHLIKEGILELL